MSDAYTRLAPTLPAPMTLSLEFSMTAMRLMLPEGRADVTTRQRPSAGAFRCGSIIPSPPLVMPDDAGPTRPEHRPETRLPLRTAARPMLDDRRRAAARNPIIAIAAILTLLSLVIGSPAAVAAIAPGEVRTASEGTGSVTGAVVDDLGAVVEGVHVSLYVSGHTSSAPVASTRTAADGRYRIDAVPQGTYFVKFSLIASGYVPVWFGGQSWPAGGTKIEVAAGEITSGVDVVLPRGGTVVGTIKGENGDHVPSARVWIEGPKWENGYADGIGSSFALAPVLPGVYTARFTGTGYLTEWWRDQPETTATTFEVRAGETVTLDARLTRESVIEAAIQDESGAEIKGTRAVAYEFVDGSWVQRGSGYSPSGFVRIPGLTEGTYAVQLSATGPLIAVRNYAPEWWNDRPDRESADLVSVGRSEIVRLGTVRLADAEPALETPVIDGLPRVGELLRRTSGGPGGGTEVESSWQWSADGVAISGATGPGLWLAPEHVGKRITLSLTAWTSNLPSVTRTSEPTEPVALGVLAAGQPTISGDALVGSTLTGSPGPWTPGTSFAYRWLADGEEVEGATSTTLMLGPDLQGQRIAFEVAGAQPGYLDSTSRSPQTPNITLRDWGSTSRISGADRYATSAAISAKSFEPGVPVVYIANGTNFPDALSGAPVAGAT
ncbi:hypothetical protein GLX25_08110, partial [Agromyces luteolus]|nr:hypothetical protein [Agromyces luteolus]